MGGSKGHRSFPFDRLFLQRMSATLVLRQAANVAARDKQSWRTAR
jgi:hypothetical protein